MKLARCHDFNLFSSFETVSVAMVYYADPPHKVRMFSLKSAHICPYCWGNIHEPMVLPWG
jgi:hypothetical protein